MATVALHPDIIYCKKGHLGHQESVTANQSLVEVDVDLEVVDDLELVDYDDLGLPKEVELDFMQKMELKLSCKFAA